MQNGLICSSPNLIVRHLEGVEGVEGVLYSGLKGYRECNLNRVVEFLPN